MSKAKHRPSEMTSFRGQPGYRNRGNRTGLDPIDSYAEAGYAQGLFIRNLFTGRLCTRNPVLLIIMIMLGLVFFLPMLFFIQNAIETKYLFLPGLVCLLPLAGIGVMFFVNVALSLKSRQRRKKA
jgi:hypothetical protein